ncbi:hypothetical protein BXY39_3319 [Eilatimonas milleporae]|uniref:Uncharacterized protein n=1 Tax=Eilatimonas milleporae TaxID=911205 RepID=A0A3M0BXP7_9PROT|nr:hypothetical protein BXY39_3319 [Eilatimonas milleporae]
MRRNPIHAALPAGKTDNGEQSPTPFPHMPFRPGGRGRKGR